MPAMLEAWSRRPNVVAGFDPRAGRSALSRAGSFTPTRSSRASPGAGWPPRSAIAIGAGTDVAIESAGVVLASDDPRGVLLVIALSRASYRKMWQNLAWATGYNLLAVPLAAGVLAGVGFVLSTAVGAILMSASTIVVALNAQLLRRVELDPAQLAG